MTIGLSPKAVLAFLFPLIGAAVGAACDWIVSGQFDVTTIRTALAGLGASGLAALGAYLGKPGEVVTAVGPPSDDQLSPVALERAAHDAAPAVPPDKPA